MSCFVHTVSFLIFFNSFYLKLIYLFLAVLGLHCCSRASSSCYKRGLLFVVVHGPVPVLVSLAADRAGTLGHSLSSWRRMGLATSAAGGIFPDQGLNPCLLHWQVNS